MADSEIKQALEHLQATSDENTVLLKELVVTVRGDARYNAPGLVDQVKNNTRDIREVKAMAEAWRNRAIGFALVATISGIVSGVQLLISLFGG